MLLRCLSFPNEKEKQGTKKRIRVESEQLIYSWPRYLVSLRACTLHTTCTQTYPGRPVGLEKAKNRDKGREKKKKRKEKKSAYFSVHITLQRILST
jgi:hypothetical protein